VDRLPEIANRDEVADALEDAYPADLRDAGIAGTVYLRFRVLDTGDVDPESVRVSRGSDPRFERAAAEVARRLRFVPAQLRGRPVRVWVELPLQFEIPSPRRVYES
jgi:TonB family protein